MCMSAFLCVSIYVCVCVCVRFCVYSTTLRHASIFFVFLLPLSFSSNTVFHLVFFSRPTPEIPTISVQCTKVNKDYSSTLQYSNTTSNSPSTRKSKSSRNKYSSKKALATFQSYLPSNSSVNEDDRDIPHSRLPSSEGEGLTDGSDPHSSYGNSPSEGSSGRSGRSRSGSLGRGLKSLSGGLHKSLSNETISTTTSGVTLKAPQAFDEDITDLLPSEITNSRGLTQARVMALTRSEKTGNTHRYSKQRIPKDHQPSWGGDGRREERRDEWEQNNQHHQITGKCHTPIIIMYCMLVLIRIIGT